VYVYLLPPDFEIGAIFGHYAGTFHNFEEIGEDNFRTPDGVRQWYENANQPTKNTLMAKLYASIGWLDANYNVPAKPIKWHESGFGCAVFSVTKGKLRNSNFVVQLLLGPFILIHQIIEPQRTRDNFNSILTISKAAQLLDERENEFYLQHPSGGQRLIKKAQNPTNMFSSYIREKKNMVEIVFLNIISL